MSHTDADVTYGEMMAALNAGEYALALEVSRDLLRQFPEYEVAWLFQGVILYRTARYDDAEKSLRRAIHFLPDDSLNHGYVHLGNLFNERGDYEKAEEYYRKALRLAPDQADRH